MIEQPAAPGHLLDVLGEVGSDRVELDMAWVHHDRPNTTWLGMLRSQLTHAETATPDGLRTELVRLAALTVAFVQALDRRPPVEVPAAPPVVLAVVAGGVSASGGRWETR